MINLSILDDYWVELDFFSKSFLEQRVRKYGVNEVLKNQFKCLDCTKLTSDGQRVQQTTSYSYKAELTQTKYVIDNYYSGDKNELYQQMLDIHSTNLKFEEDNPPQVSTYKNKKIRSKREPKEKKETAAERKLKAKAAKIGALKLNIKPTKI